MTADNDSIEEPAIAEPAQSADSPLVAVVVLAEPAEAAGLDVTAESQKDESTRVAVAEGEPEDLLGELSRAMHAAAGSQHRRYAEEAERQRVVEVDAIKVRAATEAEDLNKTSERDVIEIDAWARTATELIAAERVRRIESRREKLQAELERQDVIVGREVLAIEAAVEAHHSQVNGFFNQLEHEYDPTVIARLASSLPTLPSLLAAANEARRQALEEFASPDEPATKSGGGDGDAAVDLGAEVSSSRLMAVMDPGASTGDGGEGARSWDAVGPIAVPGGPGATIDSREPETARAGSRPMLRAIPSTRPMDRLRSWSRKPGDDPGRGS